MPSSFLNNAGYDNFYKLFTHTHPSCRYRSKLSGSAFVRNTQPSPVQGIEAFNSWAHQKDIRYEKLGVAYFEGERGLVALEGIAKDEVIVRLPRKSAIAVEPRSKAPDFCPRETWQQLPWFIKLSLKLLNEKQKKDKSEFYPYLSVLPASVDVPIFWSDSEISDLQYPHISTLVNQQKAEWVKCFKDVSKEGLKIDITSKDFQWALSCVRSRAFSGPYVGSTLNERIFTAIIIGSLAIINLAAGFSSLETTLNAIIAVFLFNILYEYLLSRDLKVYLLAPVVDLMNHGCLVDSKLSYDFFRDDFIVTSSENSSKAEQVKISYGKQSNDTLLHLYSFIEEANPYDIYVISDIARKLSTVLKIGDGNKKDFKDYVEKERGLEYLILKGGGILEDTSQVALAKILESERVIKGDPGNSNKSLNEILKELCERELEEMGTTLKEDLNLLKSKKRQAENITNDRAILSLRFRIEKKRILTEYIK